MSITISKPAVGEEEIRAVEEVLRSGNLVQGQRVGQFEKQFAGYAGAKFGVAVSSGTSALQIGLQALGIEKGDEVITTPFTFAATANAVIYCGARPVFSDINPRTFNLDPGKIQERITDKTRAILVVHLYGQPCDMDNIKKICEENRLLLIEDAAQAAGAEYRGKKVGSLGNLSAFSFYATKNITTGEGGMVLTDDEGVAERLRVLRNQGQTEAYKHDVISYNFRMTDLQAAIGIEQLKKLDRLNSRRVKNASVLTGALSLFKGIETPSVSEGVKHVFHQYTIKVRDRDGMLEFLNKNGVGARIYYPLPVYSHRPYARMGYEKGLCPVAEEICNRVLSLPVHPMLSKEDLESIIKAVRDFSER